MKNGPFKLKSGNKPSMAQLSGVSPTKQKPRGKLSFKSKVIDAAKKVTKKFYDSTTVGVLDNYLTKRKKARAVANAVGTSAKTVGALSKSRKNAAREAATRSGDKAAKSYKKQLGPVSLTLDEKTSLRNQQMRPDKPIRNESMRPEESKRNIKKNKKNKKNTAQPRRAN